MKVRRAARYALRNRYRPSIAQIISKTYRKHIPQIVVNISRNSALFALLTGV